MMIDRFSTRLSRWSSAVWTCAGAMLLLGLLTLSGCGGDVTSLSLQSLEITPANPSAAAGTSVRLTATAVLSDQSHKDVTTLVVWSSSNPRIATTGASTGDTQAISVGSSTLTASLQGLQASTNLTVTPAALVSIAITPPTPSIALGLTQQFSATGTYTDKSSRDLSTQVTWASTVTSVAMISNAAGSNGLASSVATGTSDITAAMAGITSAPVTLTVSSAALASIVVSSIRPKIPLGLTRALTATGTYTNGSIQDLTNTATWLSSDPTKLSISNAAGSRGHATGVAAGPVSASASMGAVTSALLSLTVSIAKYAYVANGGDNTVSQYTIDASGALSPMSPATVAARMRPNSVAVDPTGRYAYVSNSNENTVSQYTIDASGALTPMTPAWVIAGTGAISVTVDPTGRYAYVANNSDNDVSQFTIGAGGALSAMTPASVAAGTGPYCVTLDPSGRYAYVSNIFSNTVSQYTVGAGGALSPMAQASVAAGTTTTSVAVDPTGRYVYVTSAGDNDVSQFTIGPGGALSPMTPATVGTGLAPYSLSIDPSGRYVYTANTNNGTVSQFTIGPGGALGALTPASIGAGLSPLSITIDPTGRYTYVVNAGDNDVSQDMIGAGGALGALTPATVGTGAIPYAITTTD
jgi:6-phosphogluconolactonase (cycloisomerase 2 family)